MTDLSDRYRRAAAIVAGADALVIGAGAGMGVDSGLPDFRGREGFWQAYPALARAGLAFTQVARPHTFQVDPALAWGFYGHRLALYRATVPHAGFQILRQWSARMTHGCGVFTSNVDGHFQAAGFADACIHECHGSIHFLQCTQCQSGVWSAEAFVPQVDEEQCRLTNSAPLCPACKALARPNILMFGDWDMRETRVAQQARRQRQWLQALDGARARVAVVEIGAGTAIPSVRAFSQQIVQHLGGRLIRINPRECDVAQRADVGIPMGAHEGLRGIAAALQATDNA